MIIRVLDDERANICDELLTKLIQDERKYDDSIEEGCVVKDYFKNIIKNKNDFLLCYEEDNIIKGYIYLKLIMNNNKKGYLFDGLYVEEKYRNKKIATKLIVYSINMLNKMNINFMDINVLSDNIIAKKIYKSFGFNEFKIYMRKKK